MTSPVKFCQIPLPYKDFSKVGDRQLLKLIERQGNLIQLSKWELGAMIKTCKIKKCLDKGLGLLHEYAGLEDQISALSINGRNELTFLTTFLNDNMVDETILIERLVWLSKNRMQLILKVSDLRKLQRCPRPFISVEEEGGEKSSLVTNMRNDCNALCKLLLRKGIKWSQLRIYIVHLPILLTPLSEDTRLRIAGIF